LKFIVCISMDFSKISDNQLLELLKATMAEAIKRGGAIKNACEQEVISSQEKARIEFEVIEKARIAKEIAEKERIRKEAEEKLQKEEKKKEANKVFDTWAVKAAANTAIREMGYQGDFEINIWSRGADRRVYIQDKRRSTWKYCLYLTGNSYHPPNDLEGEGCDCFFDDHQKSLAALLTEISKSWKGDATIAGSTGEVPPDKKYLARYRKAIKNEA
jgi:hypothetical protein